MPDNLYIQDSDNSHLCQCVSHAQPSASCYKHYKDYARKCREAIEPQVQDLTARYKVLSAGFNCARMPTRNEAKGLWKQVYDTFHTDAHYKEYIAIAHNPRNTLDMHTILFVEEGFNVRRFKSKVREVLQQNECRTADSDVWCAPSYSPMGLLNYCLQYPDYPPYHVNKWAELPLHAFRSSRGLIGAKKPQEGILGSVL